MKTFLMALSIASSLLVTRLQAAVGNYEADLFEPWKWKPEYPNPLFERMDEADAFWAANLMTYFTDDVIRAVVATGQISDPKAAAYLTYTLIKRRDKCIRYWIRQTNPLDRLEVNGEGSEVSFDNAALRVGAAQGEVTYKVRWFALDNLKNEEYPVGDEIELREPKLAVPKMPGAQRRRSLPLCCRSHPVVSVRQSPMAATGCADHSGPGRQIRCRRPAETAPGSQDQDQDAETKAA
jgi:hypothetical protein